MTLDWPVFFGVVFAIAVGAAGESRAQTAAAGKKLYTAYCASCHGDAGKGDGPAARSLPKRPADHTDGSVMNPLSDQFLVDIITKGGSAVNRSFFMPAWGNSLDEKQVRALVAYLRSIAVPPYKPK